MRTPRIGILLPGALVVAPDVVGQGIPVGNSPTLQLAFVTGQAQCTYQPTFAAVAPPPSAQTGVPTLPAPPPPPSSIPLTSAGQPPKNVHITGTPVQASVNWSLPVAIRGTVFTVDRRLEADPSCCNAQARDLTVTSWVDNGVQWAGIYVYRITATYPDGSVGFVDARWIRPDPINPTNLREFSSGGAVYLQWDAIPDLSWDEVFGPGISGGSFQAINTTFVIRGLSPGTFPRSP